MPVTHKPCHPVDRRAEVVPFALLDDPSMQTHPHPQSNVLRPLLSKQGPLGSERRLNCFCGPGEGRTEFVAYGLEYVAALGLYATSQDLIVALTGSLHLVGVVFVQGSRALYVCEKEHDGAGSLRYIVTSRHH